MPGTPRQTFRISELVWHRFQKKCAAKGYTASEVLRAFIMEVVRGKFNIESLHPVKAKRGELLIQDEMILEWFKKNAHSINQEE